MTTQQGVTTVSLQVQLEEGNRYTRSVLIRGSTDGTVHTFAIRNPIDSNKAILFDPPAQNATGKIIVTSYKNPSIDTEGTPIVTPNARFDQAEDASAEAFGAGTVVSGGVELGQTVGGTASTGGGSEKATPGAQQSAALLLLPGNTFAIEIENASNTTIDIASAIAFIEVPEEIVTVSPNGG